MAVALPAHNPLVHLYSLGPLLLDRLPGEVRNKIYSYVWDEETVSQFQYGEQLQPDLLFLSHGILVPRQLAVEAITWYFTNRVVHIGEPALLADRLSEDPYGLDVRLKDYCLFGLSFEVCEDSLLRRWGNRTWESFACSRRLHIICDLSPLIALTRSPNFKLIIGIRDETDKYPYIWKHLEHTLTDVFGVKDDVQLDVFHVSQDMQYRDARSCTETRYKRPPHSFVSTEMLEVVTERDNEMVGDKSS
ncbi:hypothetical protein M011DRAFT_509522 [Sporormia fimetaria CBS 119925]|uniref:Uncharacterized protein n=1 Tax=Sporormia fimetaria CBS 119925 TaxID=1340428 RepID=A0A6A6VJ02_9PLEO|nr:hypothetical protein M011DRAFT_509522 [Sporormia fimetaria CBS 119925]